MSLLQFNETLNKKGKQYEKAKFADLVKLKKLAIEKVCCCTLPDTPEMRKKLREVVEE